MPSNLCLSWYLAHVVRRQGKDEDGDEDGDEDNVCDSVIVEGCIERGLLEWRLTTLESWHHTGAHCTLVTSIMCILESVWAAWHCSGLQSPVPAGSVSVVTQHRDHHHRVTPTMENQWSTPSEHRWPDQQLQSLHCHSSLRPVAII